MAVGLSATETPTNRARALQTDSAAILAKDHGPATTRRAETSTGPLLRTLVLAAGVGGVAEILLDRIVVPVASHIPQATGGRQLVAIAQGGADAAVGATAMLAIIGAIVFAVWVWPRRPATAALVMAATASTAIVVMGSAEAAALNHAAVIAAAMAVAALVLASSFDWHALAVAVAAAGLVAGQWPLLSDYLWGGEAFVAARSVAELALLVVPVLLAVAVFKGRAYPRTAWWLAGAGGLAAAVALGSHAEYAAMVSLWAVGATLSFPPFLYIATAACLGFVLAAWLTEPAHRHMAAGLALLAVAGLQPAAVHHNITALVALMLLAPPLWRLDPGRRPALVDQPATRA